MSKYTKKERLAGWRDYSRFAGRYWKLVNKAGDLVPYRLKTAQKWIEAEFEKQREAGKPQRGKILKYRQAGVSTYGTGKVLHRCCTRFGHRGISIADKKDLPQNWLRQCKSWYDQIPNALRPKIKASNITEMFFNRLQSRYWIGSQESQTPGMGYAVQSAHLSEMPKWRSGKYKEILDDLIPGVPQYPDTMILLESTGEVVGDPWYHSWWASQRGEDEYFALFLPWFIDEDYHRDDLRGNILELTSKEREIVRLARAEYRIEVDKSQLAWRRAGIRQEPYHGDEQAFDCKFPNTPQEAFLSGGRNVFTEQVSTARETIREPKWRGDIIPHDNPAEYQLVSSDGGTLLVWVDPKPGYHYAVGADCQWGKSDEADYDACYVECAETREICARIWGRFDMGVWAKVLASLAYYYNTARLGPERNTEAGKGVIRPLLGMAGNNWRYPELYVRDKLKKFGSSVPEDFGWYTDHQSKADLVIGAKEALTGSWGMDWKDKGAVDEMEAWVVNETGQYTHPDGQHDDRLMGRLITHLIAEQYRAELLTRRPIMEWGPLTDTQVRVIEHIEKMDKLDNRVLVALSGATEW